ncbi:MAG: hypothetical protein IIA91_05620 [Chloroflexi bacterium]|nr:hypothetical protein [Chloroflexota bacterium]
MGNSVFVSLRELRPALRLKELIGRIRVKMFRRGEHVLAEGFAALETQVIAQRALTALERQSLGNLLLDAEMIFEYEPYWLPAEARFVAHLRKSDECAAILFELHVMQFALTGRCLRMGWLRYEDGRPDVRTVGPNMLVECKLIRTHDLTRVFDKLQEASEQHQGLDIPYVIAVGFERELLQSQTDAVLRQIQAGTVWFESHPHVAAALVFTPMPVAAERVNVVGVPATQIAFGDITQVINHAAKNPLPDGFTFER